MTERDGRMTERDGRVTERDGRMTERDGVTSPRPPRDTRRGGRSAEPGTWSQLHPLPACPEGAVGSSRLTFRCVFQEGAKHTSLRARSTPL